MIASFLFPLQPYLEPITPPHTSKPSKHILSGTVSSIPPHSLIAFGLFMRLPGYAEVLLKDKKIAQCLIRLVLGVTDDGDGGKRLSRHVWVLFFHNWTSFITLVIGERGYSKICCNRPCLKWSLHNNQPCPSCISLNEFWCGYNGLICQFPSSPLYEILLY